jgi:hypothetical protein
MRLINLAGSTLLAAVGYNPDTRDFMAQFHKNGKFYIYTDVNAMDFVRVITDPESQGKTFNRLIKSLHPFREATAEQVEKL